MGNLFCRCIEEKPDERVGLKNRKKLMEPNSTTTDTVASNVSFVSRDPFSPAILDPTTGKEYSCDSSISFHFVYRKIEDACVVDLDSGLDIIEFVYEKKDHNCWWIDLKVGWELLQLKLFGFPKKGLEDSHPLKVEEHEDFHTLYVGNSHEILVTHEPSNIRITREVLQCLRPGAWLNDEVINLYLELLKERERREPGKFLTCHFFNTFFFKKLISGRNGYDFGAVRRWTTQEKLGYTLSECDRVFVPIHKDIHWCLVVINVKDETFQYLDSLGGMDTHVLEVLGKYFMEELRDKVSKEVDTSFWKRESVDGLPLQINVWDCGVFMLKYIDFYTRGLELSFNQEHIAYFREAITNEILALKAE